MKLRWYKSVNDADYRLQFKEKEQDKWQDVPTALEGFNEEPEE